MPLWPVLQAYLPVHDKQKVKLADGDLTGKFYLIDELDEDFVKACVNVDLV